MTQADLAERLRILIPDAQLQGESLPFGDDLIERVVESLDLDALRRRPIASIIGGWTSLTGGPSIANTSTILHGHFLALAPESWVECGRLTIGELFSWYGIGQGKVRAFLVSALRLIVAGSSTPSPQQRPSESHNTDSVTESLVESLRSIAAWGAAKGHASIFDAILDAWTGTQDAPLAALASIEAIDLREFAGEDLISRWDPIKAAARLLAMFDERDLTILQNRVLAVGGERRTFDELGTQFGVTRSRVQQLERKALERVALLLETDEYRAVHRRARELRDLIGVVMPLHSLPSDVHPDDDHLVDELLLHLAGPYKIDDGWLILSQYRSVNSLMETAWQQSSVGPVTKLEAFEDALHALGANRAFVGDLISQTPFLTAWDEDLIRWPRASGDRSAVILSLVGRPLSGEELYELDPERVTLNSLKNALKYHESIRRVGLTRFGLEEWGADEYEGIVPEMQKLIELFGEPIPVSDLASDLAQRFGVSETSVTMYASMHPAFVMEGALVRMRRMDEPFEPTGSLAGTKSCFSLNGTWAYRVTVDADILRGSGRNIPEHFALHLGLKPLSKGSLRAPNRTVRLGWGMTPFIGSVRIEAEELGLEIGDQLFIRRSSLDSLDFVGVPKAALEAADTEARLRLLVGAEATGPEPWAHILASALGSVQELSLPELIERLDDRREDELLALATELGGGRS